MKAAVVPKERSTLEQALRPEKPSAGKRPPPKPRIEQPTARGFALAVRSLLTTDVLLLLRWTCVVIGLWFGIRSCRLLTATLRGVERWSLGSSATTKVMLNFIVFWSLHGVDVLVAHGLDITVADYLKLLTLGTYCPATRQWVFFRGEWKIMTNTPQMVPAILIFAIVFASLGAEVCTPLVALGTCAHQSRMATAAHTTVAARLSRDSLTVEITPSEWLHVRGLYPYLRLGAAMGVGLASFH